jgi:hypothetical protein
MKRAKDVKQTSQLKPTHQRANPDEHAARQAAARQRARTSPVFDGSKTPHL